MSRRDGGGSSSPTGGAQDPRRKGRLGIREARGCRRPSVGPPGSTAPETATDLETETVSKASRPIGVHRAARAARRRRPRTTAFLDGARPCGRRRCRRAKRSRRSSLGAWAPPATREPPWSEHRPLRQRHLQDRVRSSPLSWRIRPRVPPGARAGDRVVNGWPRGERPSTSQCRTRSRRLIGARGRHAPGRSGRCERLRRVRRGTLRSVPHRLRAPRAQEGCAPVRATRKTREERWAAFQTAPRRCARAL